MTELSPLLWAGGVSALVVGATSSPHCALMCGPLACAALPHGSPERAGARRRAAFAWHGGRLAAYALCGLLLGALGQGVAGALALDVEPVLPWLMAAFLIAGALAPLGWGRSCACRRASAAGRTAWRVRWRPAGRRFAPRRSER
jgi:sulfite exporter TauE/SafE